MFRLTIVNTEVLPPVMPTTADVEVWHDHDGTVAAFGHTTDDQRWMHLPNVASFRFCDAEDEIVAEAFPDTDRNLIVDAFYRSIVPMALQARGREVLHASAVKMPPGVVALCAVSHTGKSTIAFGLGQRGYPLWADDALCFEAADDQVNAIPLPFKIRLRTQSAAFFGCASEPDNSPWEDIDPTATQSIPLAAVCVLKRLPAQHPSVVEVEALSSAHAFAAVLAHAYCFSLQDIEHKRRMMQHYLELITRVPVFEVRFQAGLEHLDAILDAIERAVLPVQALAARR
jgi:hypothetical protein